MLPDYFVKFLLSAFRMSFPAVLLVVGCCVTSVVSIATTCPTGCDCRYVTRNTVDRHLEISCYVWDVNDVDRYVLSTIQEPFSVSFHCDSGVPIEFKDSMFGYLPKLTGLTFNNCKISYIYKGAFSGLQSLQEIRIHSASSFHLQFHPNSLDETTKLTILECTNSGILTLPNLCMLEQLIAVNLTANSFVSFNTSGLNCEKEQLRNVQNVDLSENYFHNLDELETHGEAFPNLRVLNMAGNSVSFTADDKPFIHFPELTLVDLSMNEIETLPEIFKENSKIEEVRLSGNMVELIPDEFFRHSKRTLKLELQNNELGDTVWVCLSNLPALIYLDISYNELTFLNQTTLEKLTHLRHLYLEENNIGAIPVRTFQNHQNLQTLNLAGNNIQTIDKEALFGLFYLNRLELQENGIYSMNPDFLNSASALNFLNISLNILSDLPSFEKLGLLTLLDASGNYIKTLSNRTFVGQRKLVELNLSDNRISRIPDTLLLGCESLLRLDVSQNRIQYLHPSVFIGLHVQKLFLQENSVKAIGSVFQSIEDLQEVNLSSNEITDTIQRNMFPKSLEMLDLSRNRIETIRPRAFHGLDKIRTVDLRYNMIESLSRDALSVSTGQYSQTGFRIDNNPLKCNCQLYWLKVWDQSTHGPIIVNLNNTWCDGAYDVPASPVKLVPDDSFLCIYTSVCDKSCRCCSFDACDCKYTCPENCECYHSRDFFTTHYVKCSHENITEIDRYVPRIATEVDYSGSELVHVQTAIFIGMTNLQTLYLNDTHIETIENGSFVGLPKLNSLHLEYNQLTSLNKGMFEDLAQLGELYLNNNMISEIPVNLFSDMTSLRVLTLSNNRLTTMTDYLSHVLVNHETMLLHSNPWNCDCILYFSVKLRYKAFALETYHVRSPESIVTCSNGINRSSDIRDYSTVCESGDGVPTFDGNEYVSLSTKRPEAEEGSSGSDVVIPIVEEQDKELVSSSRDSSVISRETNPYITDDRLKIMIPAIIAATLVFIIIVLVACRREFIKCWLFTKFRCKSDNLGLLDDKRRYFDAFVAYHPRDENYVVRDLATRLERGNERYLLQLQHRDHPRETSELTYIDNCVKSSHRTIVVLSSDFVTDNSLLKCVTQSVRQDSIKRLIVITLGKIDNNKLDSILHQNLKQGKHVHFGESWFWEKLFYCLPDPGKRAERDCSRAEAHPYATTDLARLSSAMRDNCGYEAPPLSTMYEYNMPSDNGYLYNGSQNSSNLYEEIKDQYNHENMSVKYAQPWKEAELQENVKTLTLTRDKTSEEESV